VCGITGWIDWTNDLTREGPTIERMTRSLEHRGPDAEGTWLSPHAALGHRRLIVIDPRGGGQPMVFRDGERVYAITYNGEIYNFRDLRCELEARGHVFRTCSDTEVILHAYAEWGEDCVRRLNGIFAFGLWDEHARRLLLARDHLGVKPLFYARRGNAVIFGSELKALLAHPLVKAEVDADGLAEVLTFTRAPDSGVFRDVRELRPAHLAVCGEQGVCVRRYWGLRSAPHPDDLETTAATIRALLEDAVKRQLVADVPVVTLLSGGLDSTGVTALAAREFRRDGKQLDTYSIDFVDSARHFKGSPLHPSLDAPWVAKASASFDTRHHTVTVDAPELVENLLVPLRAHDLPTAGQMTSSLYLLCKEMKREATVALSGESADEVFGGYPWFHREAALQAPAFPWMPAFLGPKESANVCLSADLLARVRPAEHLARQYRRAIAEVPRLEGEEPAAARIREMFYLNLTGILPFLLERKDRMSMATGFEVRVPFCDHRLVEYVWNVPWEMKTVDGIEKGILRRALAGVLPDDLRRRKKSAYPTAQDPAYEEATRDWAWQILDSSNAAIQPLLDRPAARAMAEGFVAGQPTVRLVSEFERIIQLNEWLERYDVTMRL
jgi:asparagine synthase (glutamine-hydrolysing)